MDDEKRRLVARAVRAEEDAAELRARLAECYREVADARAKTPAKMRQIDFTLVESDPLERLFAAIAPKRIP